MVNKIKCDHSFFTIFLESIEVPKEKINEIPKVPPRVLNEPVISSLQNILKDRQSRSKEAETLKFASVIVFTKN